jgi:hypothetical protein
MRTVFAIAIYLREKVGCAGVVVDAKPGAESYYWRYGFVELVAIEGTLEKRPAPKPLFVPMSAVVQALRTARLRKPN